MRILIAGGAGYVGGFLTDHLVANGHEVTVLDNLTFEERFLKPVNFIFGDVRDAELIKKICNQYDCIIWLAGLVGDGACAVDPNLTYDINVNAMKPLVDNFEGKIIFASSCSVYGKNDGILDENAAMNPLSVYASTKIAGEQLLLNAKQEPLVFRFGTLFGLGDIHSRLRLDLVVNALTKKAVLKEPLTVFGGEQWRPLLHVKDIATATAHCLDNNIVGIYNLSYANYKICEIAKEVQKVIDATVIESELKFEDLRNYKVDNSKITKNGWQPKYDLNFGIKEVCQLLLDQRIKNLDSYIYSNAAVAQKIFR